MRMSDWRWIVGVNLYGVIHGITAFLPRLLANPDGGHIVNTASMAGLRTMPGLGTYAVTKYGVVALSEVLAQELAEDGAKVGVTVLCPGPVRTNIKASSRNRPAALAGGGLTDVDLETTELGASSRWIDASEAGEIVVQAIRRGDLYAFTHPELAPAVDERHQEIARAFQAAAGARA
jgi:NAD(P)-dependent dehydrogenase (short-subunit alcohol dehydrogenase family)